MRRIFSNLILATAIFHSIPSYAQSIVVTGHWENPTTGAPAVGVRMERSIDNGATWTKACEVPATATSCSDTPQPLDVTYLFRLVRFNEVRESTPVPNPPFSISTGKVDAPIPGVFTYSVDPSVPPR